MGYSSFRRANTLGPIFDGLNKVLSPLGYNILLTQLPLDWKAPSCLVKKEIDGVIFHGKMDLNFFQKYIKDLPNVGIQYQQVELDTNFVAIDNYAFSKMAVNYLYSLGHRKIGFVTDEIDNQISYERFISFKRSMEELNLKIEDNFLITWQREYKDKILVMDEKTPDYEPYLRKAFQNPNSTPTAFVCVDDWRAKFTEIALNKMNLQVPNNISLIGSDNTKACRLNDYTSFSCMLDVVCEQAAQKLLDIINNKAANFLTTTLIRPEFIPGNSVTKLKQK
jgi:DNA-binding LacI/PurR family transcriptional regulator